MKHLLTLMCAAMLSVGGADATFGDIFVNEIHYDNASTDVGEFVEVVVSPSMSTVDLSTVTISLYNGSNGTVYQSETLNNLVAGSTVDGYQFFTYSPSSIQNGAPDGVALDIDGTVVEFLSYEGALTATDGPALGLTSTDIGVSEGGGTLIGQSIQLTGNGSVSSDFAFVTGLDDTPGELNVQQSFVSVPEPGSLALFGLVGLVAAARRRR